MGLIIQDNKLVFQPLKRQGAMSLPSNRQPLLAKESVADFVALLGSALPAPGGGGAAALCGAQGYALASMVCNLTIGKKKYAEYEERLKELEQVFGEFAQRMLELIDLDEVNFLPLSKAYGLPTNTEEEKARKKEVMKEALGTACLVPLEIMKLSSDGLKLLQELKHISSRLVLSDVGVAAECFRSAIEGARFNAVINLKMMETYGLMAEISEMMQTMDQEYRLNHMEVSHYVLQEITL